MANKPRKFGMKLFWLCESDTGCALCGLYYVGDSTLERSERSQMSVPDAVVMKVSCNFLDKGHNITMDNWFSSSNLAEKLLEKNTTLLGTVKHNRRDVPRNAKDLTGRVKKSAKYYKS